MPARTFEEILKFNPYHDSRGRFTTANSATSFTYKPGASVAHDNAIAREKERDAAGRAAPDSAEETPRMKTIHGIEDQIRDQMYESAAVIDNDGNVVFMKSGAENQVGFTRMECLMMRNNTLTHNHPRSSMFSMEDTLCFAKNDMEEMRATNREGITYSIKRGNGYNRNKGLEFVSAYDSEYKSACRYAQNDLDNRGFREGIMNGTITQAQANKEFGRVVTNIMINYCEKSSSQYGIDFSVENRKASGSKFNLDVITNKSASDDGEDIIILDMETNTLEDTSFNEWLNREPTEKSFSVYKTDDDKRLVFGWASVSITVEGEQLEDRQNDMIDPEDLEEAVYDYVLNFRDTGEEHIPTMRKKGKLVESCVFTAEKQKAMGIPEGILPIGWWIGFKIEDDAAWEKVKSGVYKMFSIEGKASREKVEKSAKTFSEILKFNPYHDARGRFASADSATSFTYRPGASAAHDNAIAREREKTDKQCAAVAADMVEKAKLAEPKLTSMLSECANAVGGEMVGLEYSVKGQGSLARKIKSTVVDRGCTVEDAAKKMKDVNRYTMQLKEDNFVSGYDATMKSLESQGYEVVRVKNTLANPNASYRGINTNIKNPDGSIWELQFHTAKSLEIKEVNHKLYEEKRLDNTPPARRAVLDAQMSQNAASIPTPQGIENIKNINKLA